MTARERPSLPIVALSRDIKVARQLALVWGVKPYVNKTSFKNMDNIEKCAVKYAKMSGIVKVGDRIIITAGLPLGIKGRTNMVHTAEIR